MSRVAQQEQDRHHQVVCHATLFGHFHLSQVDGCEIAISNRRARALLAMLCLEPGEPIGREHLSKILWPGRFEAHAKASLRQCLLDLGKLLAPCGSHILVVTRRTVALNPAALRTDLNELEYSLERGEYTIATERLIAIGETPIIDQMDFGDAFNQWLGKQRRESENRLRTAVEKGLTALKTQGDLDAYARLQKAWSARVPGAKSTTAFIIPDSKTRIAVLPFQSMDVRDGHDYFADGIVDELITALGQVPQLLVAGRTSSFHFRDSPLATSEIADALRVSHLVEGSVQREGERVRIFVRLIDGCTGFENWGHRYEGSLGAIFALQETVAQAVVFALGNALDLSLEAPSVRGMTHSREAFDLFLQGRALCFRLFGEGVLDTAIALLEQAVALDPEFAEAWVALGEAHQLVSIYTQSPDRRAASERMAECARTAIAIAPDLGYSYSLLGVHQWTCNDIVGALDLAFKAYRLHPDNPAVAMRLGSFLLYCGRTTQAMQYVEAAIDQDPVDGRKFNLLSVGRFNLGDIDGAIEAGKRMVDLGFPSMWLAVATAASGEHELAVEQYRQTRTLMNTMMSPPVGLGPVTPEMMDNFWIMAAKGVCGGVQSDRVAYCQVLDMLYAMLHDKSDPSVVLPAIFMGYADMVFKSVGERVTPANMLCLLSLWSDTDPIRRVHTDPEFIPFAQRIGLADAWDKYGWPDLLPPPSNL